MSRISGGSDQPLELLWTGEPGWFFGLCRHSAGRVIGSVHVQRDLWFPGLGSLDPQGSLKEKEAETVDRTEKSALVGELNQTFMESGVVVITRQKGMSVTQTEDLRVKMREAGARYKVTKNRLARLALKGTPYEALDSYFVGTTSISTSADPVAAAKVAVEFAKKNDQIEIIGGALGTNVIDAKGVEALAKLPSIDELRSKIIGVILAPATKVAGVINAAPTKLARVLQAKADQGGAEASAE